VTHTGRTYFVEGYVAGSNDAREGNRTWWRFWTKRIATETVERDEFEHGYLEGKDDAAKGVLPIRGPRLTSSCTEYSDSRWVSWQGEMLLARGTYLGRLGL